MQYSLDRLQTEFAVLWCRASVLDLSSRGDVQPVAARLAAVEVKL